MKLKKVDKIRQIIILGSIIMFFVACDKTGELEIDFAKIKTVSVSNVLYNQVTVTGSIISNGGDDIVECGVCLSTEPGPTNTDLSKKDITNKTSDFSVDLKNLISNTPYYVRAYAINSKGVSYGEEISFTLWLNKPDEPVMDIDNNSYSTIRIGEQIWIKENLKVTHYRNGDPIAHITLPEDSLWLSTNSGAYCMYNDNMINAEKYGFLYNGYAATDERGICPQGWHIPTKEEWQTLIDYLGGMYTAGNLLKCNEGWDDLHPNTNNLSGFTALPGGIRWHPSPDKTYTYYEGIGSHAYFATPDDYIYDDIDYMWYSNVMDGYEWARVADNGSKTGGKSVRCIKD